MGASAARGLVDLVPKDNGFTCPSLAMSGDAANAAAIGAFQLIVNAATGGWANWGWGHVVLPLRQG